MCENKKLLNINILLIKIMLEVAIYNFEWLFLAKKLEFLVFFYLIFYKIIKLYFKECGCCQKLFILMNIIVAKSFDLLLLKIKL